MRGRTALLISIGKMPANLQHRRHVRQDAAQPRLSDRRRRGARLGWPGFLDSWILGFLDSWILGFLGFFGFFGESWESSGEFLGIFGEIFGRLGFFGC